jgi:hypothetical protein
MKIKLLSTALILAIFLMVGPKFSAEATHHHHNHYSGNVGFRHPVSPRTYVVERYPTTYVEEYHYYPNEQSVTVYREPRPVPVVREVHTTSPAAPLWFLGGLSLGFLLR